jgi:hypothetical protein
LDADPSDGAAGFVYPGHKNPNRFRRRALGCFKKFLLGQSGRMYEFSQIPSNPEEET